ncbi:hypothetical protein BG000_009816 [Podila horticola]|nr:hypothetical protein BG000_009816 [Podila horticola]
MTTDKQIHSSSTSTGTPLFPHPVYGETHMRPDRIDIGDGLLLRWSTKEDEANVANLMADIFKWDTLGLAKPRADDEMPKPSEFVRALVHRAFREDCRVTTAYDFALVENTQVPEGQNPLVAGISLQQNIGYFGKIKLMYGVPEIVATHPDYRGKGLMRHLFHGLIHPASDLRGDIIQIIGGIPHYYCQFGYEYAIGARFPRRLDNLASIPVLPEYETIKKGGLSEPFQLRIPTVDDVPYLVRMSAPEKMLNQAEVGLLYDEEYRKFWICDAVANMASKFDATREHRIIVDAKAENDCGLVMMYGFRMRHVGIFTLEDGYSYRDAMYPVLRQMIAIEEGPTSWELKEQAEKKKDQGDEDCSERKLEGFNDMMDGSKSVQEVLEKVDEEEHKAQEDKGEKTRNDKAIVATSPVDQPTKKKIQSLGIGLDPQHPITKLLEPKSTLMAAKNKLYTRIPSYARFLLKVAPTFEERLEKSCLAGISVTWHFDFYRKVLGSAGRGLEVVFESGKLVSASDDWVPPSPHENVVAAQGRIAKAKKESRPDIKPLVYKAQFAPLTFTRLLIGDMTMDEMMEVFGECKLPDGGDDAKMMLDILFPKQLFHFDLHTW